jgi:hypothetical protein
VRPNSGTLNEGAPLYSSFTKDSVYRGANSAGPSLNGTNASYVSVPSHHSTMSRTLVR